MIKNNEKKKTKKTNNSFLNKQKKMSTVGNSCVVCGDARTTYHNCPRGNRHSYDPYALCRQHHILLCYIDTAVNRDRGNYLPLEFKQDARISMKDDGTVASNNVANAMNRVAELIPGLQFTITYKDITPISDDCLDVRGTAIITILGKSDGSSVKSASKND